MPSLTETSSSPRIIDISAPLDGGGPYWPGSIGFNLRAEQHVDRGDTVTNSTVCMDVHVGTHIDAPSHHLPGGATVDRLRLTDMIGPAVVVQIADDVDAITGDLLAATLGEAVPARILFKTRNSHLWEAKERAFDPSFVALTFDGACWLAERNVQLVGVDHLSIQRLGEPDDTHRVLFEAGTVVLEGLDLGAAAAGRYRMVCLPLLLVGAEAAPARVILIDEETQR